MNHLHFLASSSTVNQIVMAGVARIVQFTERNDFLPVLRGIHEAQKNEVLVVNTLESSRAVAGEIFCAEAQRKGLAGIIIDGPIRDIRHLSKYPPVRFYATTVTPYSGTIQSVGEMQPDAILCGGVHVRPGDIVVGDEDGVLVGSAKSFERILQLAKQIQQTEHKLLERITLTTSSGTLASISNLEEHLQRRLEGLESNLAFRV
jgi:regulator of RNase E activity RraA